MLPIVAPAEFSVTELPLKETALGASFTLETEIVNTSTLVLSPESVVVTLTLYDDLVS